jgi:hypothetical protein
MRIFGPKGDEETGEMENVINEEFHTYSSPVFSVQIAESSFL